MIENWKTIDNFSNYQVSDLGRIKNIKLNKLLNGAIDIFGYRMLV